MGASIPNNVIIAGGGVIGSGIAFELAKRGVPVTLVERGRIGGEASWASAGIISLPTRPWFTPERVALGQISLERYPALVEELEERTGLGIEYRRPGEWAIAVDEEHAEAERAVAAWQRELGLHIEEVDLLRQGASSRRCRSIWRRSGCIQTSARFRSTV